MEFIPDCIIWRQWIAERQGLSDRFSRGAEAASASKGLIGNGRNPEEGGRGSNWVCRAKRGETGIGRETRSCCERLLGVHGVSTTKCRIQMATAKQTI